MTQPILGKPVDERTSSLGLPLPSLDNMQEDDVPRLRDALARLDALLAALQTGKAGAADLVALASELRGALGLKAAAKDLQDLATEVRAALGLKADANAVVRSWAGKKGDVAPVFADLGGRPNTLAGYGIADGAKRLQPQHVASAFNAQEGGVYVCDMSPGPYTATLPANPAAGCTVTFIDMVNKFDVSPLTIDRNGKPFYFTAENYVLDQKGQGRTFTYYNQDLGWVVYA